MESPASLTQKQKLILPSYLSTHLLLVACYLQLASMRHPLNHPNLPLFQYQIREIVDVAHKLQQLDPTLQIEWENIGDPIAKGWQVPPFLKEAIIQEVQKRGDKVFGYAHSRGIVSAREWVVSESKKQCADSQLTVEDVLFTNGLGSAISALYHMLPRGVRVIQPTPAYPAHASTESFNAGKPPILYNLDPNNGWQPDIVHLEQQLQNNSEIVGILVVNPNNPTGAVYSREILLQIVDLAERYQTFIISDEVYYRMVYNETEFVQITELAAGRVPVIVMRGMSKDVPWPGGRSSWLEFHGAELDSDFADYAKGLKKRVTMEVCATSLPQYILSTVYTHPDFPIWIREYNRELESNGNMISEILSSVKELIVNRTNGAFYMMPLFREGVLTDRQTLPIANEEVREFIEKEVSVPGFTLDKRFTYYLLASTGICVVPASGFNSPYPGFRLTTLERNNEKRQQIYSRLKDAIEKYLQS